MAACAHLLIHTHNEQPEMLTKPLDSVLLSLKLMGLPDPRRALRRCITPPDDDQVGMYAWD